ncbi:globin [Ferrimonas balearica DSM 9799]|uniref:Flavohemoprotein n=1 Tax=Ferrimonas balearica (strain DSM 9799 / CCM 4581 / KCTC 23876 / PAT) TaxID=550540 RepID=E1SVJ2_FERBD|nr:NO-inducible flavohemoprotein [Ferrimonas balearica]ADN75338.1 globin [Ferrimonas balearica DSM 9799]
MLDRHTIDTVKSTLPLLAEAGPALTAHFYQRMFHHNPELKEVFNLSHQHSGRQPAALFDAIAAYGTHLEDLSVLTAAVERIAHKHTGFLIEPAQYAIVGEHLLATLRELGGEAVTDEVIEAWGKAYGVLAQIFIDREAALYQQAAEQSGGWQGTRPFRIQAKIAESALITSFELVPVDGGAVPNYQPGQYLSLKLTHPSLPHTEYRQYSLSEQSNGERLRITVKRDGQVSSLLHDQFQPGDVLEVIPPAGDFVLATDADKPVTLISAGVGITPMWAMLETRLGQSAAPTHWLHACDNGEHHALKAALQGKLAQSPMLQSVVWYRQPNADDRLGLDYHFTGLMQVGDVADALPLEGDFYLCGPQPFMATVVEQLRQLGVADSRIHYELFGPHQAL